MTRLNATASPTGYLRLISYHIRELDSLRIAESKFPIDKVAGNALDISLTWSARAATAECT